MNEKETYDDENLKAEAPVLFGLKKEEPYQAPEGYLENFRVKLPEQKDSWFATLLKPLIWVPAMIALLIGSFFIFGGENTPEIAGTKKTEPKLEDLSFAVLDEYVSQQLLAYADTDEIMDLVGEETITIGVKEEVRDEKTETVPAIENIDEQEMEEYIMENLEEMEVY